jgi:hypothetical protein
MEASSTASLAVEELTSENRVKLRLSSMVTNPATGRPSRRYVQQDEKPPRSRPPRHHDRLGIGGTVPSSRGAAEGARRVPVQFRSLPTSF